MDMPTDRGYAVISRNADGTSTVKVGTAIVHGQPKGVYAKYANVRSVEIDPAVHLARTAHYRYTTSVVEVFSAQGYVIVRSPKDSLPA
jgi:hypothetical protein